MFLLLETTEVHTNLLVRESSGHFDIQKRKYHSSTCKDEAQASRTPQARLKGVAEV